MASGMATIIEFPLLQNISKARNSFYPRAGRIPAYFWPEGLWFIDSWYKDECGCFDGINYHNDILEEEIYGGTRKIYPFKYTDGEPCGLLWPMKIAGIRKRNQVDPEYIKSLGEPCKWWLGGARLQTIGELDKFYYQYFSTKKDKFENSIEIIGAYSELITEEDWDNFYFTFNNKIINKFSGLFDSGELCRHPVVFLIYFLYKNKNTMLKEKWPLAEEILEDLILTFEKHFPAN